MRFFRAISPVVFFFSLISSIYAQGTSAWVIDTLVGTDRPIHTGVPGTSALLNFPGGVVANAAGDVFFADGGNHVVRKVSVAGTITTVAGTGQAGYSGDGGPATAAKFVQPQGMAIDSAGNLYVSDFRAHVVRKIATDGVITTVAGAGFSGSSGNAGAATQALLSGPYAIAVDKDGVLYIADEFNNVVRKVDTKGIISQVTSAAFRGPEGLATDSAGNLYISLWLENKIAKVTTTGSVSTIAGTGTSGFSGDGGQAISATLNGPQGIAVDAAGNVWFCDSGNQRIRRIGTDGVIQTVIGSGIAGLNEIGNDPKGVSLSSPVGLFIDARNIVYWTESGNHRLRSYAGVNTVVKELAGTTLPLTASPPLLFNPSSATSDAAGNVYIADTDNHVIRKITPAGVASVVAGTGSANYNGEAGTATAISLSRPQGVSVDSQGSLFIADSGNGLIRKVDTTGRLTTVMGAGNGLPLTGTFAGNAVLLYPTGVAALGNGGFAVVDRFFEVVLAVNSVGTITLITGASAGFLFFPTGVAALPNGELYVADTFANRILRFSGSSYSNVSIFAGTGQAGFSGDNGIATRATLRLPEGVAVDETGQVFIADTGNNAIRVVDSAGIIRTIAGTGVPGFSGDKGIGTAALLASPTSVSAAGGTVLIADSDNQRIRTLKLTQIAPEFTLTSDATAKAVNRGASETLRLTLTSVGGFAGPVTFNATSAPAFTIQFSPSATVNLAAGQQTVVTATVRAAADALPSATAVVFSATSGLQVRRATVNFTITALPVFTKAGVVNAASFGGTAVSPGEIVAIFGQDMGPVDLALSTFDAAGLLGTRAGGTRVLFDGQAAPLLYSLAGQVSAIVPYAVAGKATTQVQVEYNRIPSAPVAIDVVDASPAVFNLPGGSQAAALNADLTVNGPANPDDRGDIIVLFATGEGQTSPAGVDGRRATEVFPKPLLPVELTIGGLPAEIVYAGAAPFGVAGAMQINAKIPLDIPAGPAGVVLKVGTRTASGSSSIVVK